MACGGPERMLEILASVAPCAGRPFADLSASVLRRREALSGCICVLAAWDEERRGLLRRLRALGMPTRALLIVDPFSRAPRPGPEDAVDVLEAGRVAEGLARMPA